ncbi:Unknown protein [Striga hermonthica]|uniref:Uncharacterized protein n=1 Tax=Striga hermonthica TaxID=68872 RepID=A0A9N7RGE2_STRHE|nr:Unknown protein [Striga hermonthica]
MVNLIGVNCVKKGEGHASACGRSKHRMSASRGQMELKLPCCPWKVRASRRLNAIGRVLEMGRESFVNTAAAAAAAKVAVVEKMKGRSCEVRAHSQILRIRAEDSHVGEDVANFMLFSRPILPASPLGGLSRVE